MNDMKLVVVGAAGRMGQTLIKVINEMQGVVLSGALERRGSDALSKDAGLLAGTGANNILITDDLADAFSNADGVLDFTAPAATLEFAKMAAANAMVHVIGTTGCSSEDNAKIATFARQTAVVKSGNMSLGFNLLGVLVKQAAKALDAADFDIEVLEMHHKHKVDAPSGTALLLGQAAADGRAVDLESSSVRVRDGYTGAREDGTIGFATLRGGSVVGEHSVILAGEGERIELAHKATDRTIFARGAVKAALWARGKNPGLYSMLNVLGLE
jgi:4-hydroxy-tetrahydrodipicolinate reductase